MGRILVGIDGSEPSRRALEFAVARARPGSDEIVLLTVIPLSVARSSLAGMMPAGVDLPASLGTTFEQNARQRLADVIREKKGSGVKFLAEVRAGEALEVFLEAAKELGVTEIVIGNRSFEQDPVLLGPIAERLVRHLPATVTVVR